MGVIENSSGDGSEDVGRTGAADAEDGALECADVDGEAPDARLSALVGIDSGGDEPDISGVDGRTSGFQSHRLGGAAIVTEWREARVQRMLRVAGDIVINA